MFVTRRRFSDATSATATVAGGERKATKKSRQLRPNVNKQRVFIDGEWKRLNICTRCLRTLAKNAS